MVDNERNNVTSSNRVRKSRAKQRKLARAEELGIKVVENSLVTIQGKYITVYEWDYAKDDYIATYLGTLD